MKDLKESKRKAKILIDHTKAFSAKRPQVFVTRHGWTHCKVQIGNRHFGTLTLGATPIKLGQALKQGLVQFHTVRRSGRSPAIHGLVSERVAPMVRSRFTLLRQLSVMNCPNFQP